MFLSPYKVEIFLEHPVPLKGLWSFIFYNFCDGDNFMQYCVTGCTYSHGCLDISTEGYRLPMMNRHIVFINISVTNGTILSFNHAYLLCSLSSLHAVCIDDSLSIFTLLTFELYIALVLSDSKNITNLAPNLLCSAMITAPIVEQ